MFAEEAQVAKNFVPGSPKYQSEIDWHKQPETRTAKFFTTKRRTIADDISHKSQWKEKSTPGCNLYKNEAAWKFTKGKLKGNFTNKEDRVTFVQESGWKADQTPGLKYTAIDLVSEQIVQNLI